MSKSNYNYHIKGIGGHNVIAIEDLNQGGMSVTNNIENVVDEICHKENIFPRGYIIIYKDSEGFWDGWDYNKQDFIVLHVKDMETAIELYIRQQI